MAAKKQAKSARQEKESYSDTVLAASEEQSEVTVIPVVEERLQVGKRQVVRGKVRLHKTVKERPQTVRVPLQRETVEVVRVPKGEIVSEAQGPKQEGDTLILPVYEEVLVVEKRLRLVEEVHITTRHSERDEVQEVLLREEKVRLERDGENLDSPAQV